MSNPYVWPLDDENEWIIFKCQRRWEIWEKHSYGALVFAFFPSIWSYLKSLPKGIGAHPGYFEAQLQTDYKPDNVLAFFTAISYHFHISFELQLNKIKGKR